MEELFELVVDSSEVGLRKPDPAIYRLTLERLGGVAAERTVFLDDYHPNVDAAVALGIHGILVEDDPSPAIGALHRLLRGRVSVVAKGHESSPAPIRARLRSLEVQVITFSGRTILEWR